MDFAKIEKNARWQQRVRSFLLYGFLTVWAVMVLFPFYWMLLTSVKSYGAYNSEWIPQLYTLSPTVQNYLDAFTAVPLTGYFVNTIIFTLVTTGSMLVVTVLAAFAFSRLTFRGKDLVFTLFLSLMMIPTELVVITNFVTITELEMRNTFTGLGLLHLSAEGEFLPDSGRTLLRSQGGRHLGFQISLKGHGSHLPPHHYHHHHLKSH